MKIIGVTGKSGSGKTTFAKELAKKLNCEYVDIDKVSRMPLEKPEIIHILCKKFGNGILDEDGNINRNKVLERDNISEEYFKKRDLAAIDYEENEFDYIFENNYNEQEMKETIDIISLKIMED